MCVKPWPTMLKANKGFSKIFLASFFHTLNRAPLHSTFHKLHMTNTFDKAVKSIHLGMLLGYIHVVYSLIDQNTALTSMTVEFAWL